MCTPARKPRAFPVTRTPFQNQKFAPAGADRISSRLAQREPPHFSVGRAENAEAFRAGQYLAELAESRRVFREIRRVETRTDDLKVGFRFLSDVGPIAGVVLIGRRGGVEGISQVLD